MKDPAAERAEPSDLELQVLSVLWERGPSAVRDVLDAMPDGKARAYTTVLTVLQGLEKKGLVKHKQKGRQYVYQAAATRRGVLRPRLRRLLSHVFGGNPTAVLQQILDGADLTSNDLAAMRKLLTEHEKRGRAG
jgi:predicted transcriptional regulator